jgi:hypothetical protein
MQTLVFNTSTKSVKLYEGNESSPILYTFESVPTVKIEVGYYQVMQVDGTSTADDNNNGRTISKFTEDKRVPVARFPVSNTNMLIKK